jgi:hypothetical protein
VQVNIATLAKMLVVESHFSTVTVQCGLEYDFAVPTYMNINKTKAQ